MSVITNMTTSRFNVYLIGPMGVGKTTIGKQLAPQIGYRFIDTDRELEHRTGVTVAHIFEVEGEQGFRSREAGLLEEVAKCRNCVVATGGGAVLYDNNRQRMKKSGKLVYLAATPETIWERIKHSTARPLLQTDDPYSTLTEIMRERHPIYQRLADHILQISSTSETTAKQLVKWFNAFDQS